MTRLFPVLAPQLHGASLVRDSSYAKVWSNPGHALGGALGALGDLAALRLCFSINPDKLCHPTTIFLPNTDGPLTSIEVLGPSPEQVRIKDATPQLDEITQQARSLSADLHTVNGLVRRTILGQLIREAAYVKRQVLDPSTETYITARWHVTFTENLAFVSRDPRSKGTTFPRFSALPHFRKDAVLRLFPDIGPDDRLMPLSLPTQSALSTSAHGRIAMSQRLALEIDLLARAHSMPRKAGLQALIL